MAKRINVPMSMNSIVLSGNIVADATANTTEKGETVRLKIAHNERGKASFVDVVVFGNSKTPANTKYSVDLKKGAAVTVKGHLEVTNNKGDDGRWFTNVTIIAESIDKTEFKTIEISDDGNQVAFVQNDDMPF